jgi:hypothetical protein
MKVHCRPITKLDPTATLLAKHCKADKDGAPNRSSRDQTGDSTRAGPNVSHAIRFGEWRGGLRDALFSLTWGQSTDNDGELINTCQR